MTETPESILRICEKVSAKHGTDIPKAIAEAERQIRKLDDYDSFVDILVRQAIADHIYDARHNRASSLKSACNREFYGGPAKVNVGESKAVQRAYESAYMMPIGRTVLGMLMGEELAAVESQQRAIGQGCIFNANILEKLKPLVPDGKRVQDAVKETRLREIIAEVKNGRKPKRQELAAAGV